MSVKSHTALKVYFTSAGSVAAGPNPDVGIQDRLDDIDNKVPRMCNHCNYHLGCTVLAELFASNLAVDAMLLVLFVMCSALPGLQVSS